VPAQRADAIPGATDLIDNGHSALRDWVGRVKNWRNGAMALRWTAVAFDAIAEGLRRIMGYKLSGC
jgi:hypothetical protein